jgi:hypothetical protein
VTSRLLTSLATVLLVAIGLRLSAWVLAPLFPGLVGVFIAVLVLWIAVGTGPRLPK